MSGEAGGRGTERRAPWPRLCHGCRQRFGPLGCEGDEDRVPGGLAAGQVELWQGLLWGCSPSRFCVLQFKKVVIKAAFLPVRKAQIKVYEGEEKRCVLLL